MEDELYYFMATDFWENHNQRTTKGVCREHGMGDALE